MRKQTFNLILSGIMLNVLAEIITPSLRVLKICQKILRM